MRADLPQKLEATIVRAMSTTPEDRFESVHALGRELWEFASPDARDQWRSYYRDERMRPEAKASTHAMPLIEAMARGLPVAGPVRDSLALASTAAVGPAPAERPAPAAEKATPIAAQPTRTNERRAATDAVSGTDGVPAKRPTLAIWIAAAALIIGGAVWFAQRRPVPPNPPAAVAAPSPPPPAAPLPAPASPPRAAAPAPPAAAPAAPPGDSPRPSAPTTHADKRHHHANRPPTAAPEAPADGVPIMP